MSEDAKVRSLNFYKQWGKEKNYCPALKCNIVVSNIGWDHITGQSGNKKRSWGDVYRRLLLLPSARDIVNESGTIQNIREQDGNKYYTLTAMKFFNDRVGSGYRKVSVVILETKDFQKIFLSVSDVKPSKFRPKKTSK